MGNSLVNATKEERLGISTKFQTALSVLLAHQRGMENPSTTIKYKRKEI